MKNITRKITVKPFGSYAVKSEEKKKSVCEVERYNVQNSLRLKTCHRG